MAILDAEVRDDTCTDHAQQRTGHAQHMRTLTTAWTLYTRPLIQGLTVLRGACVERCVCVRPSVIACAEL